MKTEALRRVRKLFNNPDAPAHVNRHNQRQWVRSVRHLGSNWLLAKPVERRA
jgi:phage terminase small subunit